MEQIGTALPINDGSGVVRWMFVADDSTDPGIPVFIEKAPVTCTCGYVNSYVD